MKSPVLNNFEIKKLLARKACYSVYRAIDRRSDAPVQLKILDGGLAKNDTFVMNFLGGARITKNLNHPAICRVHDFGKDPKNGHCYIASELLKLDSLDALILEEFSLSLEDLLNIFSAVGVILRHAHLHGIVHGMLNPKSIYVKPDGSVIMDDFGCSWYVPEVLKRTDARSLYLARYISPDFYMDPAGVDGRADIYSLGLILYELLAGKHPIQEKTSAAIQSKHMTGRFPALSMSDLELPEEVGDVLQKCIQLNREQRFQNVRDYLRALHEIRNPDDAAASITPITPPAEITFGRAAEEFFDDDAEETEVADEGTGSFFNKRFLMSGAAALLLVILVLFVTNYIQLPFGRDAHEDPGLLDELLLDEPGSVQTTNGGSTDNTPWSKSKSQAEDASKWTMPSSEQAMASGGELDLSSNPENGEMPMDEEPAIADPLANTLASGQQVPQEPAAGQPKAAVTNLQLLVTSDDDPLVANVFLNNKFVGKSDAQGKLEVKDLEIDRTYELRVSQQNYGTLTKQIKVASASKPISFDLKQKQDIYGTILLDAVPSADEIYIDGIRHKGRTPTRVSLKHGGHKIRLVNSQLRASWEQEVDLKIGQILRVRHDFTKKETGQVAVSLKNAAQYGFGYVYVDGKLWTDKNNTTPLQITLPVGTHTIELRRDGFSPVPKDIIVQVEKGQTKYVAFTLMREDRAENQ